MKNTKKSLPRLMGESPDRAVDRLNYTLDQGVIPNRGGVTRSGKSAVLLNWLEYRILPFAISTLLVGLRVGFRVGLGLGLG